MQKTGKTLAIFIGMSMIILLSITACPPTNPPTAPSNLEVTSMYPCTIEWQDNSDNEDGFHIYIGNPCTDCANTSTWILHASVGANVEIYEWPPGVSGATSCCNVGECTCVKVSAYNDDGESETAGIILAPVCK